MPNKRKPKRGERVVGSVEERFKLGLGSGFKVSFQKTKMLSTKFVKQENFSSIAIGVIKTKAIFVICLLLFKESDMYTLVNG